MNVSHINHVVLYAKNWYRHTNDVVADLLQIIRLDHPDMNIQTKDELYEQMLSDYVKWIESLPEKHSKRVYLTNEKERDDFGVCWEDDPKIAQIWSMLISYSIYIKDYDNVLQPPAYDFKNNLWPQFNCYPVNPFGAIPKGSPEQAYVDAAKRYLSASTLDILKNSFMSAKYNFDYHLVFEVMKAIAPEKFTNDSKKTFKWIQGMMFKLWNVVRKKVKDGTIDKDFEVIRIGPILSSVSVERAEFNLEYVVDMGSACANDTPDILNETNLRKQIAIIFDVAASRLDRRKLKDTFKIDNYSGIGLHIADRTDVTPDEFIDDHLNYLKESFIEDEDQELHTSSYMQTGIFSMSIDMEEKRVTIWYSLDKSFGCHENSLRNSGNTSGEHL